eukprot:scaffold206091_cov27-Tisochrysis_lutea.AAC.1
MKSIKPLQVTGDEITARARSHWSISKVAPRGRQLYGRCAVEQGDVDTATHRARQKACPRWRPLLGCNPLELDSVTAPSSVVAHRLVVVRGGHGGDVRVARARHVAAEKGPLLVGHRHCPACRRPLGVFRK